MRKITTWMQMLLLTCSASPALAQNVASTPTAIDDVQDRGGYYVLVMRTADSRTDNTNGNFVYYDGQSDKNVHFDETSAAENNLRGATLKKENYKYVFHVSKTDGKVSIKAYGTNDYWPAIPDAQEDEGQHADGYAKNTPANWLDFVASATAAKYEYTKNGDWFNLQCTANKFEKKGWGITWWSESSVTATVNVNDETHRIGYWESGDKNICQFQIYAVDDMPEPGSLATVTYNYTFNGEVKKTTSDPSARVGHEYPNVDLKGLPDFLAAEKPAGTVTAEGGTFVIELKEALPFKTSTDAAPVYYYLGTADAQNPAIFYNQSKSFPNAVGFRALNSDIAVNDIPNSLWYVTGNPFDGFQFHNVGAKDIVCSSAVISSAFNVCLLAFEGVALNTSNWDVRKTSTNNGSAFTVYPHNETANCWRYSDSDVKFNYEESYPNEFAAYPATFTFPMYPVGKNTYNSFAAPFDVEVVGDDIKMYKGVLDAANKELVISPVDAAPANAGVVLMGENSNAEAVTLKAVAGAQALEGNDLVGTTEDILAADLADKLIFGVADDGTEAVGFFAANSSVVSLNANHAYLNRATVQQVKGVSMRIDGEATSIGRIDNNKTSRAEGAIYDLAGRRVTSAQKGGLYIQNGRKFIVK